MAKRQSSLEGAKRVPRTGRAADFTRQAVGATRARRLSASQVATATLLGQFVEAAYAMFQANPGDPTPPPSPNFPTGYKLVAGIEMRDFIIGSTEHLFYGFIAQSTTAANQFVAAFRGTVGGVEWWDDFNSIVLLRSVFRLAARSVPGSPGSTTQSHLSRTLPPPPRKHRPSKGRCLRAARCRGRWQPSFLAMPRRCPKEKPPCRPWPFPLLATVSARRWPASTFSKTPRRTSCRPRLSAPSPRPALATEPLSRPSTDSA